MGAAARRLRWAKGKLAARAAELFRNVRRDEVFMGEWGEGRKVEGERLEAKG